MFGTPPKQGSSSSARAPIEADVRITLSTTGGLDMFLRAAAVLALDLANLLNPSRQEATPATGRGTRTDCKGMGHAGCGLCDACTTRPPSGMPECATNGATDPARPPWIGTPKAEG